MFYLGFAMKVAAGQFASLSSLQLDPVESLAVVVCVQGAGASGMSRVPRLDELEGGRAVPHLTDDDPIGTASKGVHDCQTRREWSLHMVLHAVRTVHSGTKANDLVVPAVSAPEGAVRRLCDSIDGSDEVPG